MTTYPLDRAARWVLREQFREEELREVKVRAARRGQSAKCAGETLYGIVRHSTDPDGCANDGSGCLCPCHDPDDPGVEGHPIGGRNGGAG